MDIHHECFAFWRVTFESQFKKCDHFTKVCFLVAQTVKNLPSNARDEGLIPGLGAENPTHCASTAEPTIWSPWDTTREKPMCHNRRCCVQQDPMQPDK